MPGAAAAATLENASTRMSAAAAIGLTAVTASLKSGPRISRAPSAITCSAARARAERRAGGIARQQDQLVGADVEQRHLRRIEHVLGELGGVAGERQQQADLELPGNCGSSSASGGCTSRGGSGTLPVAQAASRSSRPSPDAATRDFTRIDLPVGWRGHGREQDLSARRRAGRGPT